MPLFFVLLDCFLVIILNEESMDSMQERGAYHPRATCKSEEPTTLVWDECVFECISLAAYMTLPSTPSFIVIFCAFSFSAHAFCCVVHLGEPTAMHKRLWGTVSRPDWAQQQAARLSWAHFEQVKMDDEWKNNEKEEAQRSWWYNWYDSFSWDWKSSGWSWDESGGWSWESGGWSREPTTSRMQKPSSSSWEEDKDLSTISKQRVHEDMKVARMKGITPLSFQPQRHVTMILGRPVVVLVWFKIPSTML